MGKSTILFVDNDEEFIHEQLPFLNEYNVLTATTPEAAKDILATHKIDLVIIDIRLRNDNDRRDTSGIALASNIMQPVAKIIITNYATFDHARDAFRQNVQQFRQQTVVDLLLKSEGSKELLRAIRAALSQPKIFIVHGHDLMRENVARLIGELRMRPIILKEQPGQGRTIIQKFEDYADVAFAVVLLTPDDEGRVRGTRGKKLKPRARQNVIFELGYFVGKLGRSKVGVLHTEDIEIPSDYLGVECIPIDAANGWRLALARELKSAGLAVDLNLLTL